MIVTELKTKTKHRFKTDVIISAIILVAVGVLFIGKNLGFIAPEIFSIFVSWQMLLIVLGLWTLIHRLSFWGITILAAGLFFLIPHITGGGQTWINTYWPSVFIFLGISLLIYSIIPRRNKYPSVGCSVESDYSSDDGFVTSENNFSSVRKVVIDDVFKGAKIKNSFGGTELDLRRSNINNGDTFIDIDSNFGGIEIRVPNNWTVLTDIKPSFGGVHDKRSKQIIDRDNMKRLIIKGNISFSGIEIKN